MPQSFITSTSPIPKENFVQISVYYYTQVVLKTKTITIRSQIQHRDSTVCYTRNEASIILGIFEGNIVNFDNYFIHGICIYMIIILYLYVI